MYKKTMLTLLLVLGLSSLAKGTELSYKILPNDLIANLPLLKFFGEAHPEIRSDVITYSKLFKKNDAHPLKTVLPALKEALLKKLTNFTSKNGVIEFYSNLDDCFKENNPKELNLASIKRRAHLSRLTRKEENSTDFATYIVLAGDAWNKLQTENSDLMPPKSIKMFEDSLIDLKKGENRHQAAQLETIKKNSLRAFHIWSKITRSTQTNDTFFNILGTQVFEKSDHTKNLL